MAKPSQKPHPREARLRGLMEYVGTMALAMGLRDWEFSVHEGTESYDAMADCLVTQGTRHASLGFSHAFFELTPDLRRLYVCHELVHCHLSKMEDVVSDAIKPHVATPVLKSVMALHTDQNELATDAISRAWAPRLPLP